MGEDPDRIRQEIEQTRAEMSETVDALGYKADVKTRTKESISGKAQSVKEKLVGASDSVSDRTPDADQLKHQAVRAKGVAQENPIGLAIGSLAVGFVAGLLIPASRMEDEKFGQVSDQVMDKVKETGQEALEHGKEVAQDAVQSAQETVKESGQQHAEELKSSAQDNAQQVAGSAQSQVSGSV